MTAGFRLEEDENFAVLGIERWAVVISYRRSRTNYWSYLEESRIR
jgi:hypothetical protein